MKWKKLVFLFLILYPNLKFSKFKKIQSRNLKKKNQNYKSKFNSKFTNDKSPEKMFNINYWPKIIKDKHQLN